MPHPSRRWRRLGRERGFLIIGTLLLAVLALLVIGALVIALMAAWYWGDLPSLEKATDYRPRQHLQ